MNEKVILDMVQPYVRDNSITYTELDDIFNMLSLKEKYLVTDILYENGINLLDEKEKINEESYILEEDNIDEISDCFDKASKEDNDHSVYRNHKIDIHNDVEIHYNIRQSNVVLCKLIQEGNKQAAQDLCVKNKKLVDKYVILYQHRYGNRLDFEDLEQVGYIGLIKAAIKFDFNLENEFSTYAVIWIRQSISREIMNNGYSIRIPVHIFDRINKVMYYDNKYYEEGENFSERIEHISESLSIDIQEVLECLSLKNNFLSYASLNSPIGEDEDMEMLDLIPEQDSISVEDQVAGNILKESLRRVISTLKPREQIVIKMRYGIDDGIPRTLEEIGQELGVTRERIRQMEDKALKKLRYPSKANLLEGYI